MVKVICVRKFVDPFEVGRTMGVFASKQEAENFLGWFFVVNNCVVFPFRFI